MYTSIYISPVVNRILKKRSLDALYSAILPGIGMKLPSGRSEGSFFKAAAEWVSPSNRGKPPFVVSDHKPDIGSHQWGCAYLTSRSFCAHKGTNKYLTSNKPVVLFGTRRKPNPLLKPEYRI